MNKTELKKYIKRAYARMEYQSKAMTPENIAIEMDREIKNESKIYIAYAKLAMHNLNKSASKVTAKQLAAQIDVIPNVYSQIDVMLKAKKM